MKKILTLTLLIISFKLFSQSDSTQSIMRLQQRVDNIELNLSNSHKQFRKGTFLLITGVAVSTLSIFVEGDSRPIITGIGSGLTLLGGLVYIASHKHIGYAGRYDRRKR